MQTIDHTNILQITPPLRRTWAVFADENEENKFLLQEVEYFAVVETVRACEYESESPALYIGDVPCVRDTFVHPLYLHQQLRLDAWPYPDFLGYIHNPRSDWRKAAEANLARQAESKHAKRSGRQSKPQY